MGAPGGHPTDPPRTTRGAAPPRCSMPPRSSAPPRCSVGHEPSPMVEPDPNSDLGRRGVTPRTPRALRAAHGVWCEIIRKEVDFDPLCAYDPNGLLRRSPPGRRTEAPLRTQESSERESISPSSQLVCMFSKSTLLQRAEKFHRVSTLATLALTSVGILRSVGGTQKLAPLKTRVKSD